ncbi:MAG: hypothetical protein R3345_10915, partial [Fulvivirga sp.]|nr:hypothetical protein [Fulvivirga sp.]
MGILFELEVLKVNADFLKGYLVFLMSMLALIAQAQPSSADRFEEKIKTLRHNDNLQGFTYAYLDEYLKAPSQKRLELFDEMRANQWRKPASPEERLALTILYSNEGFYRMRFNDIQRAVERYEKA